MKTDDWQKDVSAEYLDAYNAHNAAIAAYTIACEQYRAGKITDQEYIGHRREYNRASLIFDQALEREADRKYTG